MPQQVKHMQLACNNRNRGSCFCGYNKDLFMQLDIHSLENKLVVEMETRLI